MAPTARRNERNEKTGFSREGVLRYIRAVQRFWWFVWARFRNDQCMRMAASLSYTTLLAVVPLSAIAFAMLAAFPVFEDVRHKFQEAIFANVLPESAAAMRGYFEQFVQNTAGLTAVGIVGLALTAVLLLVTIESALNTIFRVSKPRPLASRLLVFWALITLGPLLIGAGFSLSTHLFAATEFPGLGVLSGPAEFITRFVPNPLPILALFAIYFVIPNRPVDVGGAVIGSVVSGLLFAALRETFGLYVSSFPTYQTIYGAVSVIPIVLIWTYLSWGVVLLGAVLTAAHGDWRASGGRPAERRMKAERRLIVSLEILHMVFRASREGGAVPRRSILRETGVGEDAMIHLLRDLRDAKIIERTSRDGWLIARDIDALTLNDLFDALDLAIDPGAFLDFRDGWRGRLANRVRELTSVREEIASTTIRELFVGVSDTGGSDKTDLRPMS